MDVEIASSVIQYKGKPAFMTVMRNITERKQFQYEITHMAYHDALTGLPNRRKFIQQLHHLIEQSNKKASNFAAMAIDIDRFKNINDSLGHSYGDYFLVEMANRILVSLSDYDATVARMGGDEFTILVHQFDDPSELNQIAEKITDAVRQPFHLKDCDFYVTASIGIVIYPQDGMSVEELIKNAD
ncbi:TPA: diguanylate cyclase domain-containing protein, partial [Shigella sonnei]